MSAIGRLKTRKASTAPADVSASLKRRECSARTPEDPTIRHRCHGHDELRRQRASELAQVPVGEWKFSQERIDIILEALENCNYRRVAASLAGITYNTLNVWMRKGQAAEDGPLRAFYDAVNAAEALSEDKILRHVNDAVPDDWRAGMELLRRRHPKRWNRDKIEVTGPKGGPIEIKVVYDTDEDPS